MTNFAEYIDTLSPEKRELLDVMLAEQGAIDGDSFPLSFAQQRLWFLNLFEPNSALYNLPAAVRLSGQLDRAALERSLNAIIARHEVLRTTFAAADGQASQVIRPEMPLALELVGLEAVDEAHREEQARQLALAEIQRPFDLSRGPLMRALLLRLGPLEHILVLTAHHIASDGWSIGILLRELAAFYQGQEANLPELPIQYADFALWQKEYLAGDLLDDQLGYWRRQLADAPAALELPTDYPRPAAQSFRGARFSWTIAPALARSLSELSRREGATLFMTLLAGFNALLYRQSAQEDILVGSPIANRNQEEIEGLIGCFVNTLVLRTRLSGDTPFKDLLKQVSATTLEAYDHQDLPFEMLVKELRIERNLSRSALFQVMFVLQNAPMPTLELPRLTLSPLDLDRGQAKFDLTLSIEETPRGLDAAFEYNTDLFTAATVERMAGQLTRLLEGAAADPGQAIGDLPLLAPADLRQILEGWNATAADFGAPEPIHHLFEAHAARVPDAPAVVFESDGLSYRELNERANQLAWHLRRRGVGPNVPVAICLERSLDLIVGLLGILKAGGAYLPIDPALPAERVAVMLREARSTILLTQERLAAALELPGTQTVCLDRDRAALDGEPAVQPPNDVAADDLAYVIFTSGSTGVPKGVAVEHRNLYNYVKSIQVRFAFAEGAHFASVSTIAADLGNTMIYGALCGGGCLHLIADERIGDAAALAEYFTRTRIDYLKIVPSHLSALLSAAEARQILPQRSLILGGEAAGWELIDAVRRLAPDCRVLNHYGPTETTVGVITHDLGAAPDERGGDYAPLGRPIANTQIYILDARRNPVPVGVPGELYIGGAGVARGYLNRPDLTDERFVPHLADAAAPMYRSGDLARFNPDGTVQYLGRIDQQVKLRGFRIELGEIEAALRQHPQVRDGVAVLREDRPAAGGPALRRLVAYVVAAGDEAPAERELRRFLQQRLPEYMVPTVIVALERLPLTANGKLDRSVLPAPDAGAVPSAPASAMPRSPLEELVAGVMADVLGRSQIGIHDNFFELGGHSLLATQAIARLRATTQVDLPIRRLFEAPTAAGMAESIAAGRRGAALPLAAVDRSQPLPLSFAQERLWFLNQLDPSGSVYHLTYNLRIEGPLDAAALEGSLAAIVARHEGLRTTFSVSDGQPIQVVHDAMPLALGVVVLDMLPAAEQEREAQRLIAALAEQPFNLVEGPVFRAGLVRFSETSHFLLLAMHHIVADAWSIDILRRELTALYPAFQAGTAAPLAPLAVQYADFARWQREWLQAGVLESQLGYWRRQLAGLPTLDLQTDYPRPLVQAFRGALHRFALPRRLADDLKQLGRREDATLFMTLLAAFQTLLYRYTGQGDFGIGTPIANRHQPELEGVFGFFLNMLVMRGDFSGNPAFRDVLRRVRETALQSYAHQDVPFEKLVEALQPERDLSRSPLFQVMFVLQHDASFAWDLPGLAVNPLPADYASAKFDLTLAMLEGRDGLTGTLEYNADLFSAESMARLAGHMQTLLAAVVADPSRPVGDLGLLGDDERRYLLDELNATGRPYAAGATIHRLFEEQAARTPQADALVFKDRELTYGELNRRANDLARQIKGLVPDRRPLVGIYMERSLEMVVAMLAILKAGGAYLPLDPGYPADRLRFMLADAQVALVLTQRHLQAQVPGAADAVLAVDSQAPIGEAVAGNLDLAVAPADLAYVIYTSGSTGNPKGVMVGHRNAVNFFAGMDDRLGAGQPGTWLAVTSMSFDISVLELLWTLTRGFKVVIQPDMDRAAAGAPHEAAPVGTIAKPIDFSLFYFASDNGQDAGDKYRLLLEGAKFADRHEFSAVWTPERHFHSFGGLYPNPSVVGAAIAAVTERIQIRAGSVVLPLQNPLRVAEEWSVVDNISRGRTGVSFASGWHADDFVLAPEKYADRKEIMFRDIATVRGLWRGEALSLRGGTGNEVAVRIYPQPVQPELPFWVTAGGSPETFRMAGEAGANLLTHLLGQSVEELREKIAVYRRAWQEHGHGPGGGHVTLMLHTFVSDQDIAAIRETVRQPFYRYLRSSIDLWKNLARSMGRDIDAEDFTVEEEELILGRAFDRYFETSSLFGTPDSCMAMINRLKAAGVDEIGCLIDFGVDSDAVLASLEHLNVVRERSNRPPAPGEEQPSGDYSLLAQLNNHRVSHLQCTPSMARMLMMEPDAPAVLGSLQRLLLGGEALPLNLAEQVSVLVPGEVHNMYGPTETTIWSTSYALTGQEAAVVPIGRPIANTAVYILDRHLQPLPVGVPGELYIGGDGVVCGYLRRPDLTAERFVPDPFGSAQEGRAGARIYRTGDRARYRGDGTIEFLGRADHQVKVQGYRIELGEIEAVLERHDLVEQAVVVAREDQPGDKRLAAYLVPTHKALEPLKPALSPAEEMRLFADRRRYSLPNGMNIAYLSDIQANAGYREVIEEAMYIKHGIALNDGDCVFDVGANIGFFSLFASMKARDVRIYSFEPIPTTFDVLRANVALYGLNASIFPFGLSDKAEMTEFTFYPEMAGLSGRYSETALDRQITKSIILSDLRQVGAQGQAVVLEEAELDAVLDKQLRSETHLCQLRTLSEVIAEQRIERIDLLKVDVEKAEVDVLMGIDDADWKKIQQIVMEIDNRENLDRIMEILRARSFHAVAEDFAVAEPQGDEPGVYVYMLYARRVAADSPLLRDPAAILPAPPQRTLSTAELRGFLKARLPEYMVPASFTVLNALPLTPNGKVDRRALPAPASARPALHAAYVAPESEIEQAIAEIWKSVLQVEQVGLHDNFFELGGSSLLIVQARTRLREALGLDVSLVDLFRYPTVAALAQQFGAAKTAGSSFDKVRERAEKQRQAKQQRSAKGRN